MAIMQEIETKLQKGISVSTDEEVYYALLELVKDKAEKKVSNKGKKKLYYISAEFLIGKLLSNNLINLGIYDEVKETLEKNGKSLAEIEEIELEPSLGNGGLGYPAQVRHLVDGKAVQQFHILQHGQRNVIKGGVAAGFVQQDQKSVVQNAHEPALLYSVFRQKILSL